jgi:hypothetical protein
MPCQWNFGDFIGHKYSLQTAHWTYWLQILSKLCFQRVALTGNYEIVAISTDKNTFFNDLDYKADIGQHFHKSEKSARRCHRHKIIKTNLKTLVSPLLMRSQGSQWCQKMRQDPLNMPVEVGCTKIAPKLKNIRKSLRKQGFFWHFFFNFDGFWSLCLLGVILSQMENSFICKKKMWFFDTPGTPWGASIMERIFLSPNSHCETMVGFIYTFWYSLSSTSSILE